MAGAVQREHCGAVVQPDRPFSVLTSEARITPTEGSKSEKAWQERRTSTEKSYSRARLTPDLGPDVGRGPRAVCHSSPHSGGGQSVMGD